MQPISELNGQHENVTRADLRKMHYLQSVLKEIPVNTRTAVNTTVLSTGRSKAPVLIPKGTPVAYSVYTMHPRPDLYGMDAELFRPERWDEDIPMNHDPTSQQWSYLPFTRRPRNCLGLDFALTEAAYTVVRILQRYPTIELPAEEVVELTGVENRLSRWYFG
ncbi:cytochrome P450 [Aspergillus undulatus]|uniref:cytochrome P450 n=1 Tax=Aspergillus undulatus TaxID=1810928 RepID=UPI003CCD318A